MPKTLNRTRTANQSDILVVGRNNPFVHYATGNTTISLELDFHAEDTNREDVIGKCLWLESFMYNNNYENPPERLKLTWGTMFRAQEVWLMKACRIDYSQFDSVHNWLPRQASVHIELQLDPNKNLLVEDIRWKHDAPYTDINASIYTDGTSA